MTDASDVEGTCYRQLRFRSSNPRYRFDVALYLSPDERFLTTDLNDSTIDPSAAEKERIAALRRKLERNDGAASRGPADAPVTIVIFSDFPCPFCSQLAKGLASDILPSEGDRIRVVFRNFSLEMHTWARQAAEIASGARKQGDLYSWKVHDYIFDPRREIRPADLKEQLVKFMGDGNFDTERFQACLDERRMSAEIEKDLALGNEAGVGATPIGPSRSARSSVNCPVIAPNPTAPAGTEQSTRFADSENRLEYKPRNCVPVRWIPKLRRID